MERHCIRDFAFDPVDRVLWARLDHAPSSAWVRTLELGVHEGVSGAAIAVEPDRLSLPVPPGAECDALAALFGLVTMANVAPSSTSDAGR